MYGLARPFLFQLDAERAHGLGLASLEAAYRSGLNPLLAARPPKAVTKAFGIEFQNPVGLAAGLVLGWSMVILSILAILMIILFFGGLLAFLGWMGASGNLN